MVKSGPHGAQQYPASLVVYRPHQTRTTVRVVDDDIRFAPMIFRKPVLDHLHPGGGRAL